MTLKLNVPRFTVDELDNDGRPIDNSYCFRCCAELTIEEMNTQPDPDMPRECTRCLAAYVEERG